MKRLLIIWAMALLACASYAQVGGPGTVVVGGGGSGGAGTIGGTLGATDDLAICTDGTGGSTIGVCTQMAIPAGTVTEPAMSFVGDSNTGIFSTAGNTINLGVNGIRQVTVEASAVTLATGGSWFVGAKANVLPKTNGVGSPFSLSTSQSFGFITNEGTTEEVYISLPAAGIGLYYFGCVQDSDGLRFTAAAGDTIRSVASVTSSGGYISSTTIGSCVSLMALNNSEWMALSITGTWSFN